MISVIDHSEEGYMSVVIDEPDYKDEFEISAQIYKEAYVMDGGDNLRSICFARMKYFKEHPEDKMAWDSYLTLRKQHPIWNK